MIRDLQKWCVVEDLLCAEAVVDEMVMVFAGNRIDPPEFGPALCQAEVLLGDEPAPADDAAVLELLNAADPEWRIVDDL